MKKSILVKRRLAVLVLVIMFIVPSLVVAASYSITFDFTNGVTGKYRAFDGNNIAVYTNSNEVYVQDPNGPENIIVELHKKRWYGAQFMGTEKKHPRNGVRTSHWSDVGSGEFRVKLWKANDGNRVKGTGRVSDY